MDRQITAYTELAPSQLLDRKWRELVFDLAPGHNTLQDITSPETGSGYIYRDSHSVGSPSHNRFLYWRSINDTLELIEMSSEIELEGGQVRIRFSNSYIVNSITVIELYDSVVIMVATSASVHRLHLPHPRATDKSILHELTTDFLYNPANYHLLNQNVGSPNSQQPISAAAWQDSTSVKMALSLPSSSILIVQFSMNSHQISTYEIKQIGIIGRLWSRMPNLLSKSQNECDNTAFICVPYFHEETNDVLLFALCRDLKIRVFSTTSRECICTHNLTQQQSFSQSYASHTNLTIETPMMKLFGHNVIIYLTEFEPEFIFLSLKHDGGVYSLVEKESTIKVPNWEKLVDFSVSESKIWALAHTRETEASVWYTNLNSTDQDGETWDFFSLDNDLELGNNRNYVAEIFWRSRFSTQTVQKALVGTIGASIPSDATMEFLEQQAITKICDDNQEESWAKFYNYCLQNHQAANKAIAIVSSPREESIIIVKRNNPSFICPWVNQSNLEYSDMPYRAIESNQKINSLMEPLGYIFKEFLDDNFKVEFEQRLFDDPSNILTYIEDMTYYQIKTRKINPDKFKLGNKNLIREAIKSICVQLDLTTESLAYGDRIIKELSSKIRSEYSPLSSNSGIALIFELFKIIVRARMLLARDVLVYLYATKYFSGTSQHLSGSSLDIFLSEKINRVADLLRSYAILVWVAETPIKGHALGYNYKVIDFVASCFKFFNKASNITVSPQDSTIEQVLRQNLLMNFLVNGGIRFSNLLEEVSDRQSLSNSFYLTSTVMNLCRLLWPAANHLCFAEFLFTHHLDEHFAKYDELCKDWLPNNEYDHYFIRASNCILQRRTAQSVDLFNRLWPNISETTLLSRFVGYTKPAQDQELNITEPKLIHSYYEKLIQLFQINNDLESLVMLTNSCLCLLDGNESKEQKHWIDCLKAKLFQYYLDLEEPEEAYHAMVLIEDGSMRTNCLRKFIVSHCEKEHWAELLAHPFIEIKDDFIDILNQRAESSDLSKLNADNFYKTSYYDLLFSSYISYEEYKYGAEIMYKFAQRLAQEVPGLISIKKQADCLLIALNSLRCLPEEDAFIDDLFNYKDDCRSGVVKRAYDSDMATSDKFNGFHSIDTGLIREKRITANDIKMRYELTLARLKLLEKDQSGNAIALSPLSPEEIISQLVASSMFPAAIDLALLFKSPMDSIFDGLTAKFIFIKRLTVVDLAVHEDIEKSLLEIFTGSYRNIETYNYIANSTSHFVDRLWRLIDYYLTSYDGIGHLYNSEKLSKSFSGTTLLMRVVADKLLSTGYDIPASLARMYCLRNPAELLKLHMKYDKLIDAADLSVEMIKRVTEPSNTISYSAPQASKDQYLPPVYLPTHLILLLLEFLNEDATNTCHLKAARYVTSELKKFRDFIKSSPA